MKKRMEKQIRCIRRYAASRKCSLDVAAQDWVEKGLAAEWAKQN